MKIYAVSDGKLKKSRTAGSQIFSIFNAMFLTLLAIICAFPVIHMFSVSLSSQSAVAANQVKLLPVGFNLASYHMVAKRAAFWTAFGVSVKRVIVGVVINTVLTVLMAYPLSKSVREFPARRYYVWLLIFAMIFDGGLIPNYLQVKNLNLFDTIWALVLPGAVPIYNVILVMNFMKQLPDTIEEAAEVDGASYFQRFTKIILPLCKPSIATIILFSFLSHWNGWFDGKIYNNTVVIDKQGSVVASYSKVHLFGLFNEERFFAAGDNFDTYELNGVICGSTICYDLRFPELYRHLSLQGAKIIFVPAEWPSARGDIWTLLSQARGAENHNYIVAVNCVGNFKGAPFYGHSMVVDPMGKIIAEGGSAEEIIYCDIDLAYIDKVRARLNALADVRKELIR